MKAAAFDYVCPDSIAAALRVLNDPDLDAAPLAGGQSLVPMMNFRLACPDVLVDLNRIPGLSSVLDDGEVLRIGAMTRYATLMTDPLIAAHVPLFGMALPFVAHAAIRNRGTIGGSVALADPAAEMPALLLALGATVVLEGPNGVREVPADDFFLGLYETAREPGELVTAILVPKANGGQRFAFHEVARRHGDYAMAGVAVRASDESRVAFFAVSDRAVRSRSAEASLREGNTPDLSDIDFHGDQNAAAETKVHLARVVLERAVEAL